MFIRVMVAASVLLLAVAPAVEAQGRRGRPATERAGDCDGGGPEVIACIALYGDREDARLNRAYQAALAVLPPNRQQALRVEQRKWIKDRDADCLKEYEMGGSGASAFLTACHLFWTESRADALERIAPPSSAALAKEDLLYKAEDDKDRRARLIQREIAGCYRVRDARADRCAAAIDAREDARLNRVYKAVMARTPAAERAALRDDQRSRLEQRDDRCDRSPPEGDDAASRREALEQAACGPLWSSHRAFQLEQDWGR